MTLTPDFFFDVPYEKEKRKKHFGIKHKISIKPTLLLNIFTNFITIDITVLFRLFTNILLFDNITYSLTLNLLITCFVMTFIKLLLYVVGLLY